MINNAALYFIRFGHLDFPKIGTIKWQKQEAQWQEGVLFAPQEAIVFEAINVKPTKQFYNFLADHLNISNDQAAVKWEGIFNNFNTASPDSIEIGNLGILKNINGAAVWESYFDATKYYKDINLASSAISETMVRQDDFTKKDKWIWWALAFFILSIITIAYKYL